ncbi:MAG: hypothetical protein Q4B57_09100 [Eubacteriales bacterium]|nr:hypothetical protein [Eubacteriales bacterium]
MRVWIHRGIVYIRATEFLLKTILNRDDITIVSAEEQKELRNPELAKCMEYLKKKGVEKLCVKVLKDMRISEENRKQ